MGATTGALSVSALIVTGAVGAVRVAGLCERGESCAVTEVATNAAVVRMKLRRKHREKDMGASK